MKVNILDKLSYVTAFLVHVVSLCERIICPFIDNFIHRPRCVILPVTTDGITATMKDVWLNPLDTTLYYYFKYESSYDYKKVMDELYNIPVVLTMAGPAQIVNIDDDIAIK